MQRWIAIGVAAAVLLAGLAGGAYFARKVYKQNVPHPVWVPIPVRTDTDWEEVDRAMDALEAGLGSEEMLMTVSKDLGLPGKMELPDDAACAAVLKDRLFIRKGDAETPMGSVPAIHVGLKGKNKDSALTTEIVTRLMDDVWKILGVQPPPKN